MSHKNIPLGINDFKKMIEGHYYYVDQTKLIEDLVEKDFGAYLFTRPNQFGKSLNVSMLKYFFDIQNKDENKTLFSGLYIENTRAFKQQGQYPVVSISLQKIQGTSFEEMSSFLKVLFTKLFQENQYLIEGLDQYQQKDFKSICNGIYQTVTVEACLDLFVSCLHTYWDKQVIVLIDDYDTPILNSKKYGYYDTALMFFNNFYTKVIKSNQYVKTSILTGTFRINQIGSMKDLNNVKTYSILDQHFSTYFGFTKDQVVTILNAFDMNDQLNEITAWYGGYNFGKTKVYNPYSLLHSINENDFKLYLNKPIEHTIISNIFNDANIETSKEIEDLIEGKSTFITIRNKELFNRKMIHTTLIEFLLFNGYLTIVQKLGVNTYEVAIPNNQVKSMFKLICCEKE